MAEIRTPDLVATYCNEIDDVQAKAGAFEFYVDKSGAVAGMIYACPCGCGATGALNFKPAPSPSWTWDGNREKPTLHPSAHHVGHWHGWLQGGVWKSC